MGIMNFGEMDECGATQQLDVGGCDRCWKGEVAIGTPARHVSATGTLARTSLVSVVRDLHDAAGILHAPLEPSSSTLKQPHLSRSCVRDLTRKPGFYSRLLYGIPSRGVTLDFNACPC